MRNKLSIAFTLVAFYALLLPTTTLAVVAGRVGPDIFRISTTGYAWSLADGDATVQNQTASGLNTTVFDTLYGTVTVNLPDDLAAGDTISGTVISAPKKPAVPKEPDAKPTPDDDDAGMDQLNGMVVEVAKQKTPSQMHDNDLSPVCAGSEQKPNELTKTVCNKWTLPDGASKIPVELKNKDGKVIGRTEVPIAKKAPSVKEPEFLTPATGQAGKPVSVKGPFDGDFKNTAIKLGDQTAKFLASSPRKVVVESPRSLKGTTDIQVEYKGKTVAKCSYRSVSVKLAADKLSLKKGEQTSLTVTVAGLIGLLSPLPMQLTNQSAGNLLMEGGQAQTVMIDPKEVNGDLYMTRRTLTGLNPGGFSITAVVDPASSVQGNLGPCNSGNAGVPQTDPVRPGPPRPEDPPTGQPTGQPTPSPTPDEPQQPARPMSGTYRVTLNGFRVNHATYHGPFAHPDVATFFPDIRVYEVTGRMRNLLQGGRTNTIGRVPSNPVRGGSATPDGGLTTGDGFPTNTPWQRTTPFSGGAPGTIPPVLYFEGELVQNTSALVIIPNIWNMDGFDDRDLHGSYLREIIRSRPDVARAITGMLTRPPGMTLGNYVVPGDALGIRNTLTLPIGVPQDRPIGMQPVGREFGFTPKALIVTYDGAEYLMRTDFGFGRGVVPVRYVDAPGFAGDYTLFFQIERVDTMPPCADPIAGVSASGPATLTTTNPRARGPYYANLALTVDFTDCLGTVRITNFPPIATEPFTVEISAGVTRQNVTTVTRTGGGGGTIDRVTGRIAIPVTLHFAHSLESEFGLFALPSDLTVTLTTDGPGGRRLSAGNFTLVGEGPFVRGFLASPASSGSIVVNGTFSRSP